MLTEIDRDIWIADGPSVRFLRIFPYPTRMTVVRLTFWNRRAARESLRRALAWDPQRLIIAHGEWVRENGSEELARSFAWLS